MEKVENKQKKTGDNGNVFQFNNVDSAGTKRRLVETLTNKCNCKGTPVFNSKSRRVGLSV